MTEQPDKKVTAAPAHYDTGEPALQPVECVQTSQTNGLGTAGFIVSIFGCLTCGLLSPLGMVLSLLGLRKEPKRAAVAGAVIAGVGCFELLLIPLGLLVAANFWVVSSSAKIKAAQAQISALKIQVDIYQLDIGAYPTTQQGLQALRVPPADLPDPTKWTGPYARTDIPPDPWSNPYYYELVGPNEYRIYSSGPDGVTGTDDDITSRF